MVPVVKYMTLFARDQNRKSLNLHNAAANAEACMLYVPVPLLGLYPHSSWCCQQRTIIFCTTQFSYLKNRENCIHDFTGGPLLA